MDYIVYGLVYLGSALMVYNIIGFIRFAGYLKKLSKRSTNNTVLYIPIALLVMFLLGYLAVGIFGDPDIIVSGILFGGSIFVFIMYLLLNRITKRIFESEHIEAKIFAAEESSRAKTAFLSSVSHEMRTPMNVIIGLDTIALKEPGISNTTKDHLEKIGVSAKHLLGLINSVLELNMIEEGRLTLGSNVFSLNDALEQLNVITGTLCENKGLNYVKTFSDVSDHYFMGDEVLLTQALLNILDNAVKYTDAPGSVEFNVGSEPMDGDMRMVRFIVKDTGVGMEKEFIDKVFDVFAQEDQSSTNRFGGTGLGLSLTKKIVDLMGGTIHVESEKNVGTVFTVKIPFKLADMQFVPVKEEPSDVSLEGRRILIVEDIPENAEIVADLLELEGAESEHAEDGSIGVDMFAKSEPGYYDAILMDLRMPVMDGLTACREIRKLKREDAKTIPIIALTANAFDSDVKQTFEAGMNAHLAKPADADTLYSTIKRHIALSKID